MVFGRFGSVGTVLIVAILVGEASSAEPKVSIKLDKIKAADVEKAIAAHKGKVVVLDVWAEF